LLKTRSNKVQVYLRHQFPGGNHKNLFFFLTSHLKGEGLKTLHSAIIVGGALIQLVNINNKTNLLKGI